MKAVKKAELRDSFECRNRISKILSTMPNDYESILKKQFEIIFEGGLIKGIAVREIYAFGKSFCLEKEDIDAALSKMHQNGEISYPQSDRIRYEG